MKNQKPMRHQEAQEKGMGPKNCLPEQNAAGLNEKDDENGVGVLCREMEDWYRGEENSSMTGAA